MTTSEEEAVIDMAVNTAAAVDRRVDAISALASLDPAIAIPILLEIGARNIEPSEIARAVGLSLAALMTRELIITEFDMRNLRAEAYEAFCAADE